jgi:hypothetical protein
MGVAALACVASCSSTDGVRQQLDERTGATMTWVDAPWIFARERPELAVNVRDYLNLYAVDVNKSGKHQVLVLVHGWSTLDARDSPTRPAVTSYDLIVDDRIIRLQPATQTTKQLGIGQTIDLPRGTFTQDTYCPISIEELRAITLGRHIYVRIQPEQQTVPYATWKEARRELIAFVAQLRIGTK